MKVSSIIGLILGLIGLILGLYNQFSLAPYVDSLRDVQDAPGSYLYARMWAEAHSFSTLMGMIVLLLGALGLILALIPAIKTKTKLSLVAVVISFLAIVFGILQGTHLF